MCPRELCFERERAARWHLGGRARRELSVRATAPDLVLDYEPSLSPELILYTDVQDLWSAVEDVLHLAHRLHHREAPR